MQEDVNDRIDELEDRIEELETQLEETGAEDDGLSEHDFRCPACGLTARSFRSAEAASEALATHMAKHRSPLK